ncbi:MFS transporter [Homoserinibacter sp. YIM 151385]|uniref:MFS transporter n=1 Tax=Homoserinibacter sp. YIM 151385 TaxID=2985506 RepID=UPI0022F091E6|nr:MFS transporter [Homoserinibacter sp. YIM 151385]WBU37957.1 MFS transporter [Homoserinibacter sp. YIM 151385]
MNVYTDLLRTPGVARIIAAQLTARFPSGMLSLGYLLHMEHLFHSYGAAGLVLAATSVGQAVAGPLTSRWMGVWGMRPVIILTTAVCAASMTAIAFLETELWVYMVLGLVCGLSYPPVQPAVRTIYPKMVNSRQLTPLFSLDASAQELIWIAGPVVVTFVSTQVSTVAGIGLSIAFLIVGGLWFLTSPELGRVRIPRSKRKLGVVLGRPPVLLATVVGFLVVGSCAAIEAGVVAEFGEGGAEAGIVLAIWAVASLLGGLGFGHLPLGPWALARRTLVIFLGTALAAVAWDFWTVAIALVIAGLCLAPALAAMFAMVSASVRFSDTAEAYGWVGTGQLIGAAAGSAVAGFLIDARGPDGAFWASAAFAAAALAVAAAFHRAIPDLRGRDASPIPDTEPVPVTPS